MAPRKAAAPADDAAAPRRSSRSSVVKAAAEKVEELKEKITKKRKADGDKPVKTKKKVPSSFSLVFLFFTESL
jgi:hypothetical protein